MSMAPPGVDDSINARVLAGARRAIARWGIRRTSADDIAREAGVSRASVYRVFPGGKDAVVQAVIDDERGRLEDLMAVVSAEPDMEERLIAAVSGIGAWFSSNETLQFVLAHEADLVGPHLAFAGGDQLLARLAAVVEPLFDVLPEVMRGEAADFFVRLVRSHLLDPSAFVALADTESVRRLVRTFVLPALSAPAR